MSKTAIIIVNWNGAGDTIECLESLLRLDNDDFRVIIVDNGSTDGSIERIETWAAKPADELAFSDGPWRDLPECRSRIASFARIAMGTGRSLPLADITLIEAGSNLGFAGANNLGMDFAAGDPDVCYYWILNNDTVVSPDALAHQQRRMDSDVTIGILGARLMFYSEPDVVQGLAGGFYRMRARGFHHGLGLSPMSLPQSTDVEAVMAYALGASMFVRRTLVDCIGGMSEEYFLYFEEIDWARRMPQGMRLAVMFEAVVWHKEGGSIGSDTRSRPSETSLYYLNASLLRFYARHDRMLLPIALVRVVRDALGYLRRHDTAAVRAVLLALIDVPRGVRRRGRYGSAEFADLAFK